MLINMEINQVDNTGTITIEPGDIADIFNIMADKLNIWNARHHINEFGGDICISNRLTEYNKKYRVKYNSDKFSEREHNHKNIKEIL